MRKDKAKNVWKVALVIAEDPHATHREIAERTDLWLWTVNRAKEELELSGTKDEVIAYIVGWAKDRLYRLSGIFDRYIDEVELKNELDRRDVSLMKDVAKDDLQRVTIFWWEVTDDKWWLKNVEVTGKSLLELDEIRRQILSKKE